MSRHLFWAPFTACLVGLAGCGTDSDVPADEPAAAALERGPKGEEIARVVGLPSEVAEWRTDPSPVLVLGGDVEAGPELFGRIDDAAFLADGGVVVADGLNLEVRAFGADGTHRWSAGGAGQGPGQFVSLASVDVLDGDSIFAIGRGGPGNLLAPDGTFVRRVAPVQLGGDFGPTQVTGATGSGHLLGYAIVNVPQDPGHYRGERVLLLLDGNGQLVHQIEGMWPSGDWFRDVGPDGAAQIFRVSPDLVRTTQVAPGSNGFVVNVQESFRLHLHHITGALERVIDVAVPARPVDREIRRRYVEGPLAGIEDSQLRARLRAERETDYLPPELPMVGQILVDTADRIWVEAFALPDEPDPMWWVFDRFGEVLARARLPHGPQIVIRAIAADKVLLTRQGELGVPILEVLTLVR